MTSGYIKNEARNGQLQLDQRSITSNLSNDTLSLTTNGIPNPFKTPSNNIINTNPTQISEALRILDENFYKEIAEISRLFEEKHNQYLLKRHELSTRLAKSIQSMENPHSIESSDKIQNGHSTQFIN